MTTTKNKCATTQEFDHAWIEAHSDGTTPAEYARKLMVLRLVVLNHIASGRCADAQTCAASVLATTPRPGPTLDG